MPRRMTEEVAFNEVTNVSLGRRGSLGPLAPPGDPVGSSLARMLRFERRWLVRVFELLLPRGSDARLEMGGADVPLGRFVDDIVTRASMEFVTGLRLSLWLVMLAPWFLIRRRRTLLGLSPEERTIVLERLRTNQLYLVREALLVLKTFACLAFCGLPQVQDALGIHPIDRDPPSWASANGSAP
jgi:hypothetical protein